MSYTRHFSSTPHPKASPGTKWPQIGDSRPNSDDRQVGAPKLGTSYFLALASAFECLAGSPHRGHVVFLSDGRPGDLNANCKREQPAIAEAKRLAALSRKDRSRFMLITFPLLTDVTVPSNCWHMYTTVMWTCCCSQTFVDPMPSSYNSVFFTAAHLSRQL